MLVNETYSADYMIVAMRLQSIFSRYSSQTQLISGKQRTRPLGFGLT